MQNDVGRYPSNDEGLAALTAAPQGMEGWRGPYLNRVPNDAWGHPFVYKFPGERNPSGFDIYSFGPDGREGNDDITNWQAK